MQVCVFPFGCQDGNKLVQTWNSSVIANTSGKRPWNAMTPREEAIFDLFMDQVPRVNSLIVAERALPLRVGMKYSNLCVGVGTGSGHGKEETKATRVLD